MVKKSIARTVVAATLMLLMAGGSALAQRGERGEGRGGGGGRGGGDGGSSRSFSGGGGRGGGGGERGSSRSLSRGDGGSSRSLSRGDGGSSRSLSRGDSGSSRSLSRGGGEGSARSFSRGSSRSPGESGSSDAVRRSFSRSTDDAARSFSGQSRSRSLEGSRSGRGATDDGPQFRSYRGGKGPTFGDTSRGSFRSRESGDRSSEGTARRGFTREGTTDDGRRTQFDQARRDSQTRRASEDQVRDFLQMRRDGGSRDSGDQVRRLQSQLGRRDGDRDGRDFRDGDFRGRDRDGRGGRDYDNWRRDTWLGERGEGRDHRDWSGKWRDGDRFRDSDRIRNVWWRSHNWDNGGYPFSGRWWGGRNWNDRNWGWWGDYAYRHRRPNFWWTWAAAPRLASWVTYGWPSHYYWDYGPGEYIYYDDGAIYVNGQWYQPGPVFYDRTVDLVERAPDIRAEDAAQMEWLPLGVFAVTRDGSAEPEVMVQLAVTQDGVIGGTAFHPETGEAFPVEGIVEKETQRAVWSFTDASGRRILQETSIFNLTQPEATGLVHYGPQDIQVVHLVRLEQPEADAALTVEGELPTPVR